MVGEILRFDHCRCLEKQLSKLLGVKPPSLIVPLPFRNLLPFWMKFVNPPFQCIFTSFNPIFMKKRWNYVCSTCYLLPVNLILSQPCLVYHNFNPISLYCNSQHSFYPLAAGWLGIFKNFLLGEAGKFLVYRGGLAL